MPDMEKVEKLISILEERSGLDVREAVARNIYYLDGYESYLYRDEVKAPLMNRNGHILMMILLRSAKTSNTNPAL